MAKVIIYTTNTCPNCVMAKKYLKTHNVKFEVKNVQKDVKAFKMFAKKGYNSVPVISINGKDIIGFNKPKLKKALGLK